MTEVRKLHILLCGYEIIRKSACLRGASPAQLLAVPICAYLLETERGFVLFDTGLDPASLSDPDAARRTYVNDAFPSPPVVLAEHELGAQLEILGVRPGGVTDVILSHGHSDHTGGLRLFPEARIWIQRSEHQALFSEEGRAASNHADVAGPIDWRIMEGDWELMPGIEVLFTPGHRPGHQSAMITLPSGARKISRRRRGGPHRELRPRDPRVEHGRRGRDAKPATPQSSRRGNGRRVGTPARPRLRPDRPTFPCVL